jgi:hypothetical protein
MQENNEEELPQVEVNQEISTSTDVPKLTYKQYGFYQSRLHNASPAALLTELKQVRTNYLEELKKNVSEQEKSKSQIRQEIESLRKALKFKEDELEKQNADTAKQKELIYNKKETLDQLYINPKQFQYEKPNRLSFTIGLVVLVILTIYLWIFYTSAGYSAFFRDFVASDIKVANSIFDAEAIVKAWRDGVPAFVLVASMPFIFLALGYLIHQTLLQKHWTKWLWMTALIVVTFIFDFIIAYEIVSKIYQLKKEASPEAMPDYSFRMAIFDVNFWLIIFAGFVTYLIWGFLFDTLMRQYEGFDVVKQRIKMLKLEIKEAEEKLQEYLNKESAIKESIAEKEKEINHWEYKIAGVHVNLGKFEHIIYSFSSGWLRYIEGGQSGTKREKEERRIECNQVTETYLSDFRKQEDDQKN